MTRAYQADEFDGVPTDAASDLAGVPDAFQRLWTPHRLVYIQHGQQPDEHTCPFCRAPEMSDEQSLIVARGTLAYVLLNLYPSNSGHLLVCPYRHIATYDEATPEEVAEIGELTQIAMCWCRCSAMPAPAMRPWFMPMLNPSHRDTCLTTRIAICVSSPISATSSGVASS